MVETVEMACRILQEVTASNVMVTSTAHTSSFTATLGTTLTVTFTVTFTVTLTVTFTVNFTCDLYLVSYCL